MILTAWMYLTPIIYPASVVPPQYGKLIALNPFSGLIESYRRTLLDGRAPDWAGLSYFGVFAALAFVFGYWWFARTRRGFA
ncbi:ABC transporter permease, partial [Escherichia coli]|nr:ABC transporter permease [Escherichia coli]